MFICSLSTFKLTAHKKVTLKNEPRITPTSQTGQGMRIRQIVQKVVLLIIDKKKKAFYMK
jgi:hypothetical protein